MNQSQRQTLLKVARAAVVAAVKGATAEKVDCDDAELAAHCGCFVTLKTRGRLRGCIGQFVSEAALVELVAEMAKASATSDPRFFSDRIKARELEELELEISVLSPLKRTRAPMDLRLGIDGIYVKKGRACGCFLPQVATESGWSREEFLSYCCSHKAGLAADAWKNAQTEVYLFTAEVFGAPFKEIARE